MSKQDQEFSLEFFQKAGSKGGKKAAARMTQAQRTARAKRAGKARQRNARAQKGGA